MPTPEQLSDDETGKAFLMAAYHAIHRGHVEGYCHMAFSKPGESTKQQQTQTCEALFAFATLGWSAFHLMNKGAPLKDKPGTKKKAKASKGRKKHAHG